MKITNDELSKMVGYEVGRELRLEILQQTEETGKDIREVAAQYNLPTMAILDPDGKFDFEGQRVTPQEWERLNPLGEYGKIVVIKTDEND